MGVKISWVLSFNLSFHILLHWENPIPQVQTEFKKTKAVFSNGIEKYCHTHTHTHTDTSSVHLLFLLSTPLWARWLFFFFVWLWDFGFACFLFGWLVVCFGFVFCFCLLFLQCKCINHAAELIRVQATDHISAGMGKIKLETRPKGRRER